MDEIPHYLRDRVSFLIDQKVEKRVQEHMALLKEEVYRDLEEQYEQNTKHIEHYKKANESKYFEK